MLPSSASRAPEQRFGLVVVAALMTQHGEQVRRVGDLFVGADVIGADLIGKDGAISRVGRVELAVAMHFQSGLK